MTLDTVFYKVAQKDNPAKVQHVSRLNGSTPIEATTFCDVRPAWADPDGHIH